MRETVLGHLFRAQQLRLSRLHWDPSLQLEIIVFFERILSLTVALQFLIDGSDGLLRAHVLHSQPCRTKSGSLNSTSIQKCISPQQSESSRPTPRPGCTTRGVVPVENTRWPASPGPLKCRPPFFPCVLGIQISFFLKKLLYKNEGDRTWNEKQRISIPF